MLYYFHTLFIIYVPDIFCALNFLSTYVYYVCILFASVLKVQIRAIVRLTNQIARDDTLLLVDK